MLSKKFLSVAGAPEPTDDYFKNVTMLLHGDGTNGAQNNTFVDSSSYAFSVTRNGNTTQGTFTPFSAPEGYWGISSENGGTISLASGVSSTFAGWGGRTRTFECWVYRNSSAEGCLQQAYAAVAANGRWFIYIGSNNKLGIGWTTSTGSQTGVESTITVPVGQWAHIAICVDSTTSSNTTIYFCVNGAISTSTGNNFSTQTSTFGWAAMFASGQYLPAQFQGMASNIRWSSNIRYSGSSYTVPTARFTNDANTFFLFNDTRQIKDSSSNNYHPTSWSISSVPQSPFSFAREAYLPSVNGGSAYYDGTGDWTYTSNNSAFQVAANQAFTIEAWVYPFQLTDTGDVVSYCAPIAAYENDWGWELTLGGGVVRVTGVGWYYPQFPSSLQVNAWNHIAMKRDTNGTLTCYLNGVAGTPVAASTGAITPYIQQYSWAVTLNTGINVANWTTPQNLRYLKGYVSDVRYVVGSAITPPAGGPTAPLATVANTVYHLKTQNAGIIDNAMMNDLETVGNAQISTSVKKYGTGSIAFDGSGDYLVSNAATSNLCAFGAGDYTIEMWIYFNNVSTLAVFYDSRPTATNGIYPTLYVSGGSVYFYINSANEGSAAVSTGQWYHLAVCRSSGTVKMFLNGTQSATWADTRTYLNGSSRPVIGSSAYGSGDHFNGYIDDLRITKGYARYTSNFTTPSAALPDK